MLSIAVTSQLTSLVSHTYLLLDRLEGDLASEEVELRVGNLRRTLHELAESTGLGSTRPFASLSRHLHWILRRHSEGRPDLYAPDIRDIRDSDLPAVIASVESWGKQLLDPGLVDAVRPAWEAQHYGSAVRDAFIYLEGVLRELGAVDPGAGLSGAQLVSRLLAPTSKTPLPLQQDGFMGHLTGSEREGVFNFVKGAFLLFRNATAHRPIAYTASEAEDIIHVVNVCLRLLPSDAAGSV